MRNTLFLCCILCTAFISGCGLKPSSTIPAGLTIEDAVENVKRQTLQVTDLTGWGHAISTHGSSVQTAKVSVKYIRPDIFKAVILGFAGIELATVASDGDSVTAYIPTVDGFIRAGLKGTALAGITPYPGADISDLITAAAGSLPIPESDQLSASLAFHDGHVELTMKNADAEYIYFLKGNDLRVVECRKKVHGMNEWVVERSRFKKAGDVFFPKKITVIAETGKIEFEWSSFSLNTGISKNACTLTVPEDANRLFPRSSRK